MYVLAEDLMEIKKLDNKEKGDGAVVPNLFCICLGGFQKLKRLTRSIVFAQNCKSERSLDSGHCKGK